MNKEKVKNIFKRENIEIKELNRATNSFNSIVRKYLEKLNKTGHKTMSFIFYLIYLEFLSINVRFYYF